jgi:hypothetical protein
MKRIAAAAAVFALAAPCAARAHRLDEYLQAARVDVTRAVSPSPST